MFDTEHRGRCSKKLHVLDYMVTRGVSINAKVGDSWKLQLRQLLYYL